MLEQTAEQATTPTRPKFPRQGEWTYEDWLKFPDDGWKYEIIDGVLCMTPPPAVNHQRTSTDLLTAMRTYAKTNGSGEVLPAPCGVRLPNHPVPVQPDIFFIKQERLDIIGTNYIEGAPDLIVEILSPSNVNYDRETKFNLYQEAGVSEYWLVDYQAKTVEVFTLVEGDYTLAGKYTVGDTLVSGQLEGFKIAVETIFNF
jgi:Uma2 family endonuclease